MKNKKTKKKNSKTNQTKKKKKKRQGREGRQWLSHDATTIRAADLVALPPHAILERRENPANAPSKPAREFTKNTPQARKTVHKTRNMPTNPLACVLCSAVFSQRSFVCVFVHLFLLFLFSFQFAGPCGCHVRTSVRGVGKSGAACTRDCEKLITASTDEHWFARRISCTSPSSCGNRWQTWKCADDTGSWEALKGRNKARLCPTKQACCLRKKKRTKEPWAEASPQKTFEDSPTAKGTLGSFCQRLHLTGTTRAVQRPASHPVTPESEETPSGEKEMTNIEWKMVLQCRWRSHLQVQTIGVGSPIFRVGIACISRERENMIPFMLYLPSSAPARGITALTCALSSAKWHVRGHPAASSSDRPVFRFLALADKVT